MPHQQCVRCVLALQIVWFCYVFRFCFMFHTVNIVIVCHCRDLCQKDKKLSRHNEFQFHVDSGKMKEKSTEHYLNGNNFLFVCYHDELREKVKKKRKNY